MVKKQEGGMKAGVIKQIEIKQLSEIKNVHYSLFAIHCSQFTAYRSLFRAIRHHSRNSL